MAKATSSRKPARVKRKGTSAAKRAAARKPVARARKVTGKITTAKTARLRRAERLNGRPTTRRAARPLEQAAESELSTGGGVGAAAPALPEVPKTPVREPERVPSPLPVPIASFTF